MADVREVFPVLVDEVTDEGRALTAAQAGDAAAAKTGLVGFAFKTHNGQLVLPTLTPEGKIPVDFQGAGVSLSASSNGPVAGSLTNVTVAEVTLAQSKTYGRIQATGSCFREAIFEIVQQNDTVSTIIGSFLVGPGQFTFTWNAGETEVTSGATGTQKLILRAKNLQKASDFRGNIAALEFSA
jgi:hypothetical protein